LAGSSRKVLLTLCPGGRVMKPGRRKPTLFGMPSSTPPAAPAGPSRNDCEIDGSATSVSSVEPSSTRRSNAGDTADSPKKSKHDKPVLVYDHDEGASVIGGVVVRDEDLTNLYGRYLFTDFYTDRLRSFVPQLTKVDDYVELDTEINAISSFSEDPVTREVYVTSRGDEALYRLEPAN